MDVLYDMLHTAFRPGDAYVFVIAAAFMGLATARFSSLWLAVLMAVAVDVAIPGAIQMIDGSSYDMARVEALHRIAIEGGAGLLLRTVGYFIAISFIVMIKKTLGHE